MTPDPVRTLPSMATSPENHEAAAHPLRGRMRTVAGRDGAVLMERVRSRADAPVAR